jgi:hypothetical protein
MATPVGSGYGRDGYESALGAPTRRAIWDLRRVDAHLQSEADGKMEWGGKWVNGRVYEYNDVVLDDGWTMICRTEGGCDEKPAPIPTGDETFAYLGNSPTSLTIARQIVFGNKYTFQKDAYLNGYRIYTEAGNNYTAILVLDPDGDRIITEVLSFAGQGGWEEFNLIPVIIAAGTTFELLAVTTEPDPTPTTFEGNWAYSTPPNMTVPLAGQIIHPNSNPDVMRVSTTDDDLADRTAELAGLEVGDVINGPNIRWTIQAITPDVDYYAFDVLPALQDGPDGVYLFVFETVTPTPINYMEDLGYWTSSPLVAEGVLKIDDGTTVFNDNAYGTDIVIQEALISQQWEVVAPISGDGGSVGGGGGDPPWDGIPEEVSYVSPGDPGTLGSYSRGDHAHYDPRAHDELHDLNSHTDVNAPAPAAQNVLTWNDQQQTWEPAPPLGAVGFAAFAYRFDANTVPPPNSGYIEFNNADPSLVTEVTINDIDSTNQDISVFLSYIEPGAWLNVSDRGDYDSQRHSYDVTGPPVDNGTYWSFPVTPFENIGLPFSDNQQINLVIRFIALTQEYALDDLTDVNAPTPADNDIIQFNTANGLWENQPLPELGGSGFTYIQDTPPATPNPDETWWDSGIGLAYVWYDDGDTQQWVQYAPGGGGNTGAVSKFPEIIRRTAPGNFNFEKANYPGLTGIRVMLQGAGGGGGGAGASAAAQGSVGGAGGAGGYIELLIQEADLNASEPYTVGAGGLGGTGTNDGTNGLSTTGFGAEAFGGVFGRGAAAVSELYMAGLGGGASNTGSTTKGEVIANHRGQPGQWGMGTLYRNVGGIGGVSTLGSGGSPGNAITAVGSNGGNGTFGGGGGGGANRPSQTANRVGGDGGDGVVVIEVLYAGTGGGGTSDVAVLDDLDDVDTTTTPPTTGDSLTYDGALWVPAPGGGSGFTYVQETAPTSPAADETWWRTSDGKTFFWYVDADSSQWVQYAPGAGGSAGTSTLSYVGTPLGLTVSMPNNVNTAVPFTTIEHQSGGWTINGNGELVCPVTGWYTIIGSGAFTANGGGTYRHIQPMVNGAVAGTARFVPTTSGFAAFQCAIQYWLEVGDRVWWQGFQNSGETLDVANCQIWISKTGDGGGSADRSAPTFYEARASGVNTVSSSDGNSADQIASLTMPVVAGRPLVISTFGAVASRGASGALSAGVALSGAIEKVMTSEGYYDYTEALSDGGYRSKQLTYNFVPEVDGDLTVVYEAFITGAVTTAQINNVRLQAYQL